MTTDELQKKGTCSYLSGVDPGFGVLAGASCRQWVHGEVMGVGAQGAKPPEAPGF